MNITRLQSQLKSQRELFETERFNMQFQIDQLQKSKVELQVSFIFIIQMGFINDFK